MTPDISIILCTCNPRFDILEKVFDALNHQTLPPDRWELIIVDNNSNPPLEMGWLKDRLSFPVRLIQEPRPGVSWGRSTGIDHVNADLILMLDDDNILDEHYLETALSISSENPTIGAFGGIARPMLEIGEPHNWQKKMYPYLAIRDYGNSPITSNRDEWGHWEPIGAGMIVRTPIAHKFAEYIRTIPLAAQLDRRGTSLLSGYDSLLARCAYRLGYSCSYQPALKLTHFIKKPRLKPSYLIRLLYGHGRSIVILNTVLGYPTQKLGLLLLLARLPYRFLKNGFGGAIAWAWDWGYFLECRAEAHAAHRG